MGGRAFTSGQNALNVVRLQHAQYIELRDHYLKSETPRFLARKLWFSENVP